MELLLGGLAAAAAGAICNPFEVVKIRMQLQGELKARGQYAVHYRNVFHATWTIASKEGVLALQKGVTPFVCYQFMANTARLGLYQILVDKGWTRNVDGSVNGGKTLICSMGCGALGGFICSPLFLVSWQSLKAI
jgi:solute carrier family 25 protein 34/35